MPEDKKQMLKKMKRDPLRKQQMKKKLEEDQKKKEAEKQKEQLDHFAAAQLHGKSRICSVFNLTDNLCTQKIIKPYSLTVLQFEKWKKWCINE